MRDINEKGLALIKDYEKLSLVPYFDAVHVLTIGWGHAIKRGESFTRITPDQADQILQHDLDDAKSAVDRLVKVDLNDNQYAALVSFTFNAGSGALGMSHLLIYLNQGNYDAAAGEFGKWCKGHVNGQLVTLNGLVRRRADEAALFRVVPDDGPADEVQTSASGDYAGTDNQL